jgi:hypothetical protein
MRGLFFVDRPVMELTFHRHAVVGLVAVNCTSPLKKKKLYVYAVDFGLSP